MVCSPPPVPTRPHSHSFDFTDTEVPKRAPITVKYEIPYFTVSGIQVRYLKVVEKSGYQALPWVRYVTQNGDDYRFVCSVVGPYVGSILMVCLQLENGVGERQRVHHSDVIVTYHGRARSAWVFFCIMESDLILSRYLLGVSLGQTPFGSFQLSTISMRLQQAKYPVLRGPGFVGPGGPL